MKELLQDILEVLCESAAKEKSKLGKGNKLWAGVNPLNPNMKIHILICYPYTFSKEVVGRICWGIN